MLAKPEIRLQTGHRVGGKSETAFNREADLIVPIEFIGRKCNQAQVRGFPGSKQVPNLLPQLRAAGFIAGRQLRPGGYRPSRGSRRGD